VNLTDVELVSLFPRCSQDPQQIKFADNEDHLAIVGYLVARPCNHGKESAADAKPASSS
jgi:hypothetical protein